jgi:hypothetical protein
MKSRMVSLMCLCVIFASGQALAADEQRVALARETMAISDTAGALDTVAARMAEPWMNKLKQTHPAKALEAEKAVANEVSDIKSQMLNEIALLMAEKFSEQELIEIRDFYRSQRKFFESDIGKRMIGTLSGGAGLEIGKKHMERLMVLMTMAGAGVQ